MARDWGQAIAGRLGLSCRESLLVRRRSARPQASVVGSARRLENVRGLYGVGRLSEVPSDAPLILVDDQITSGASLAAGLRLLGCRGNPVLGLALAGARAAPRELSLDTSGDGFLE